MKLTDNIATTFTWIKYDFMDLDTRPKQYGTYLVCRKDGKTHLEVWNGCGFAYNNNSIEYWAKYLTPKQIKTNEHEKISIEYTSKE